MKISLLRHKENFNQVFAESLILYFQQRYSCALNITWQKSKKHDYSIVNDQLNVIYPENIKRTKLNPLTAEFNWNKNKLKHLLQRLYVFMSVRFPFEDLFSHDYLTVLGDKSLLKNCVFIPGNHSHRIINIDKNICTVFSKKGSMLSLTITDAKVRLAHKELKAPQVFEHNFEQGWYDEERVIGLPYNRLGNPALQQKVLSRCEQNLRQLYVKTTTEIACDEYINMLYGGLSDHISQKFSEQDKIAYLNILDSILAAFTPVHEEKLTHALSHGDFQPANILCASDDYWIIDWEYAQNRTIFYDALVFNLESRFISDLAMRLINFHEALKHNRDFFDWTGFSLSASNSHYLFIFLLEDLTLKLRESNNQQDGLKDYFNEIDMFLRTLSSH